MQFGSCLERYYFEKYILDVAIATLEQGGVTSRIDTYQFLTPIDAWGFPKYPGKTAILEPGADIARGLIKFIQQNKLYLCEPDTWLGTWVNPATHCCYLDITLICSGLEEARSEALKRSEQRRIVALYNFLHNRTVYL